MPRVRPDDPETADGCIPHDDDFLQYYLGAYMLRRRRQRRIDEDGQPSPIAGTEAGRSRAELLDFDETGAGNQDNTATFVVDQLDPATRTQYPSFAYSRKAADWLRPARRRSGRSAARSTWPPGADSRGYKRLSKTVDVTGATTPAVVVQVLGRRRGGLGLRGGRGARHAGHDDWTTLPDVDGND